MSAFVKKLVEKASMKKPAGFSDSLRPDDLDPRPVFHYGIPSGSLLMAYDSIQQLLAISTVDGQIKLFGRDGAQILLESPEASPSKFLLFVENQGILLNINANNHIEVWDIIRKSLSSVHHFEMEITSFAAMQHSSPYLYVGDTTGSVSVLKLDKSTYQIERMKYRIPVSASRGETHEVGSDVSVKYILPQPTAVSKRVLIIFSDGVIALWSIQESRTIYRSGGGTALQTLNQETKKVTAACWTCSSGTKVAIGYSNGDILLWGVPCPSELKPSQDEFTSNINNPICKLNLGYKSDKIPIAKMKWMNADEKSSRLYVLGSSDYHPANLLQVVLLNEHTETRTIKIGLNPPELSGDFEITTSSIEQNKHRRDCVLLLGKSSHVYAYDDSSIEKYLAQSQTKSSPSLPKDVMMKLPYGDSSITITKFITGIPCMASSGDEDFNSLVKNSLPLFPFERTLKDGSSNYSSPFSKCKNLFITGHSNGAIHFWDASCTLLLPVTSITQQSDNDLSVSGVPLTSLHFNYEMHVLVTGDQSGMVRMYTFKSEAFAPQTPFLSFQGSSKKGSNLIRKVKVVKVNGAVISINTTENLKQLAVGSDQGYVTLIDPEGPSILYQTHISSELCTGIISAHFETCSFHGFEKNVLLVATKDSSAVALERDTGNRISTEMIRPKKPYQALFSEVLNGQGMSVLLMSSEKAVYVYSLTHLVEGVKKVLYKKKFHSSCIWASTFGSPAIGIILLFSSGKIEIRSIPELSLVRERSIRGLTSSTSRPSSDIKVSSSHDGELVIVNGDQELLFVSTLTHNVAYRFMDSVSQVFIKDLRIAQGVSSPLAKEKKKGFFGSVAKDDKASKSKNAIEVDTESARRSIEELSTIFAVANFPDTESETKFDSNEDEEDIDIDDIDIDDPKEKPKGFPVIAGLNKQNITSTFQALKGKLKNSKGKNDKVPVHDEPQDEKNSASVDLIKKKYGYASSGGSGAAENARTKLSENLNKLQGISLRTNEMQDTARSFSSMAKEVLKYSENERRGS